jgi:hypothetical protein
MCRFWVKTAQVRKVTKKPVVSILDIGIYLALRTNYMAQLQYEECMRIQVYLEEGKKHRWIGKKLGRSNSTISAEVGRYSV